MQIDYMSSQITHATKIFQIVQICCYVSHEVVEAILLYRLKDISLVNVSVSEILFCGSDFYK